MISTHRLGHKGKVDVKLKPGIPTARGAPGGGCYPDHLPVLMHVPEEANHAAVTTIQGDLQGPRLRDITPVTFRA